MNKSDNGQLCVGQLCYDAITCAWLNEFTIFA